MRRRTLAQTNKNWTAAELRKLSAPARDAILRRIARRAESEYRSNAGLTDFEAFGEQDLHGYCSCTETR